MRHFLKNRFAEKMTTFFLVFFYIYSVLFPGMPAGTRVLISGIGIGILLLNFISEVLLKRRVFLSKNFLQVISLCFFMAVFSLFIILVRHTRDLEFVKYPFFVFQWLGGGYVITVMQRRIYGEVKFQNVSIYIVASVVLQVIIAFLMFISPPVHDLFTSINLNDPPTGEAFREFRLVGFASYYFGAGIICGYTLILIPFLIPYCKNKAQLRLLSFSFLLILLLGMMMSRTTMLGGAVALILLFLPSRFGLNCSAKIRSFLSYFIIIPILIVPLFFVIDQKVIDTLKVASEFGFEMFYNYLDDGNITTDSTEQMKEMYKLPESTITYLLGDGKFYNNQMNDAEGYYMGTDIGFLRLLYYFGIVGSLLFFLLQFMVLYKCAISFTNKRIKFLFVMSVFVFILILNFKGLTDLIFLNVLFGGFWLNQKFNVVLNKQSVIIDDN
ncbi:hypothetical protein [Flavobacterium sp. IB48]|uniref:hypothetical protein n=1 Tax=Flavobacterium sp. IB48 TaxID=2779375 RepID=UPI0018E803AC|nr:hypothetical protein [Flavobacterium sp. IB48]MBJ2126445.1 hypothetical protein [Flavobacterium sp. IB48]